MGRRSRSARLLLLLPLLLLLLAALGSTGLRVRESADVQALRRPDGARPSPALSLRFEPELLALGGLDPGERRETRVAWRRVGAGSRRVLGVEAGCGCVVPRGFPDELAAGTAGTLALEVQAPRRPGPFRARVRVWLDPSSGPEPPTLEVYGYVGSRVGVRPAALSLGPRTVGSEIERVFEVVIDPALAGPPIEARLEGLDGEVSVEPSAFAGRAGATLRVRALVTKTPGPVEGRVVVEVAGESASALVRGEAVVRR